MQDAEKLCNVLCDYCHVAICRDIANRLGKKVLPDNNLQQARALKIIAGLQQPCADFSASGFSTFYGYYMLEAMAKAGAHKQALDIIRQYWGAMLDLGATTSLISTLPRAYASCNSGLRRRPIRCSILPWPFGACLATTCSLLPCVIMARNVFTCACGPGTGVPRPPRGWCRGRAPAARRIQSRATRATR